MTVSSEYQYPGTDLSRYIDSRGRRGRDRTIVGFTTTSVSVQSVPITTKVHGEVYSKFYTPYIHVQHLISVERGKTF
jgi:hypothetical protein